jgi:hypothetical protein
MEVKTPNNNNTNQQDTSPTYATLWVVIPVMRTYKKDEVGGSILIKCKNDHFESTTFQDFTNINNIQTYILNFK